MTHLKKFVIVAIASSLAFTLAPTDNESTLSAPVATVSGAGGILSY